MCELMQVLALALVLMVPEQVVPEARSQWYLNERAGACAGLQTGTSGNWSQKSLESIFEPRYDCIPRE